MGNIDRTKVFSYLVDSYRNLCSAYLTYSRDVIKTLFEYCTGVLISP